MKLSEAYDSRVIVPYKFVKLIRIPFENKNNDTKL